MQHTYHVLPGRVPAKGQADENPSWEEQPEEDLDVPAFLRRQAD